jgi:hypothetical protein
MWPDAGPIAGAPDWAGDTVFVDRRHIAVFGEPAGSPKRSPPQNWTRPPASLGGHAPPLVSARPRVGPRPSSF